MWWWPEEHEWPRGGSGCAWGDDSSWKVQHLDLSAVRDSVIRRDDRFGYIRLAAHPKLEPRDFIRCPSWHGERRVEFHVERDFNLTTGELIADKERPARSRSGEAPAEIGYLQPGPSGVTCVAGARTARPAARSLVSLHP
jgi:hypothetical protein